MLNSQYFHLSEFACHDGTPYPVQWLPRLEALCSQLDLIRQVNAGTIRVVSGYRTLEYNTKIGGAKQSQHMAGTAADISPVANYDHPGSVQDLYAKLNRMLSAGRLPLIGGLGIYPSWIHVDVRPRPSDGHVARWTGTGIGSEQG